MTRYIEVSRIRGILTLSLTPRSINRMGYELVWYLDSLKDLYKNSGHSFVFSAETLKVYNDHMPEAERAFNALTPGQLIFFKAVMSMLGSPSNGDLDDNLRTLMMLKWVFDRNDFAGDLSHKLRYTTRFSGDRMCRIITFKDDIREMHGEEACAMTCTALAAAIKRSQSKRTHFQGIDVSYDHKSSRTSLLTSNFMQMRNALISEIKSQDEVWLKANYRHVVSISQFFVDLSDSILADENQGTFETFFDGK
ncbi:hypothetical protein RYA05_01035 [Pseudomonas syringae pv. actinidiae]|nr:hypothetical protein [Pseudomonas syringae pv. actinidiae]